MSLRARFSARAQRLANRVQLFQEWFGDQPIELDRYIPSHRAAWPENIPAEFDCLLDRKPGFAPAPSASEITQQLDLCSTCRWSDAGFAEVGITASPSNFSHTLPRGALACWCVGQMPIPTQNHPAPRDN